MKHKGSMIILAVLSTLVLSVIMAAGMMVSHGEVFSTQNLYMYKNAFFTGVRGVETVTDMIYGNPNPTTVILTPLQTNVRADRMLFSYQTGTLEEMQGNTASGVKVFQGFDPPPLVGVSLGTNSTISPILWDVKVTAEVRANRIKAKRMRAYSEIEASVYSTMITGY